MCLETKFDVFFGIFLLFIKMFCKIVVFNDPQVFLLFIKIRNFQTIIINSKKIPKNVKYVLQSYFNIEITFSGLDRLFGATNWFCDFQSPNSQSKLLDDVISILKCDWRQNFTYFRIFLLFVKMI